MTPSPIIIGLAVLYLPCLYDLFRGAWSDDDQAHGPIILGISCWLLYRKWAQVHRQNDDRPALAAGWSLLGLGLIIYTLGRSQAVLQMEIGSVLVVLTALILITRRKQALRQLWFPLFFMCFMIPLPGVFVQTITIPLKTAVSVVAAHVLYQFDYPIARSGSCRFFANALLHRHNGNNAHLAPVRFTAPVGARQSRQSVSLLDSSSA